MKKKFTHFGLLFVLVFIFGVPNKLWAQLPPPPMGLYNSVTACQGDSVTLVSPTEYQNMTPIGWHGPNNFTSTASSITVPNTNTVGSEEYFFDLITQNGVFISLNYLVTINARPATPTAISNGPICANSTLSLNTALVSGATYSWAGPNNFMSSLQNPTIPNATAQNTGVYTVTVTKSGCRSLPGTVTGVVNTTNPPTAAATQSFCGSATVAQLAATGTAIQWFATANSTSALTPNTILTTGNYYVSQTVNSCVSQRTSVAVVINPLTTHTTTISACDSYTWTAGSGTNYTSSGNYTYVTGCHTETLALTITPTTTHTTTIAACDSYTWTAGNGTNYTSSGNYTYVTGCHTETLALTITPSTTHTTTVSACDSYTWTAGNGTNYTSSGNYTYVTGCHTETLALTITPTTTHTTTVSACDSYTWIAGNGTNYTSSGNYTYVTGCHTETLALTITPSTSHTTTISAYDSYTWVSGNGATYATSGNYTYVTDCHTEILNLTISPTLQITLQPTATSLCSAAGSTATIGIGTTVPASGYAWQYRVVTTANPNPGWITIGSANAGVYSNYNTANLGITRTATLPAAGTQYRAVVTDGGGTFISDVAALALISTTKGGTIAVPSMNVCLGNAVTFTVSGHSGTSLQWQSAASATGTFSNIPGATGSSYTLANAQLNSKKSYRVLVTNNCSGTTAFSTVKTITVNPPTVAGTIIGGGAICTGSNTRMSIVGQTGKVQWQYSTDGVHYVNAPKAADGQTVPFSTTSVNSAIASYMIANLSANVYFRAKVSSGDCDVLYAAPVQYVLYNEASVGTVTPVNSSVCEDSATTLNLSSAIGAITWEKSVNYLEVTPTWTPISSSNVLEYNTQTMMYDTAFRAKVTIGSCSTKYSNLAYVRVIKKAMVNTITKNITTPSGANSASALCTNTSSKVLSISTENTNSIQWQWSSSSVTSSYTDIAGATSPTYTVTNAIPGANYFRVKLTNSCGRESVGTPTIVYYKDCTATKLSAATFDVVAYPNPYQNEFSLHLSTTDESEVTLFVYDITGKQIEQRSLTPSTVNEASIGKQYQAGIYQLVVTQGSEIKTVRVIKQ